MTWNRVWPALAIGAFGWCADFLTKEFVLAKLDPSDPPQILGGLVTFRLIRNPGAAFSMGENLTVALTVFSLVALIAVAGWLIPRCDHRGWRVVFGLLLAGILGNVTDRLFREPGPFRGHVIDFIQLPYFAIFNVADICITFAAAGMLYLSLVRKVNWTGETVK